MLRATMFFAFVAVAVASPISHFGDDFPPHPGCHYNITPPANFKVLDGSFKWYFDTVTSAGPLTNVTCIDLSGKFTTSNTISIFQADERFVIGTHTVESRCLGANSPNAHADFTLACKVSDNNTPVTAQYRIAETDHKTYGLITVCAGPAQGPYVEAMGIIGPKKSGIDPAVRQRLTKRLVAAGWTPSYIKRVPSQSGC